MVLRDGAYVTADDLLFRLEGVYVPATGRLHAVLHTTQPLYTSVDTTDIEQRSLQYRYVTAWRCTTHPTQKHPSSSSPLRQALRTLAGDWMALRGSGLSRQQLNVAQRVLHGGQLPLQKQCEFRLDVIINEAHSTGGMHQHQHHHGQRTSDTNTPNHRSGGMLGGARRLLLGGPPARDHPPAEPLLLANGSLYSPNCHIVLDLNSTSVSLDAYYAKAVNYSLMMTAISFVQV